MKIYLTYDFLRYFLPLYLLAFLFFNLILKTITFQKKYGVHPLIEGKSDNLQKYIEKIKYSILLIGFATILLYSLFPGYYWITVPIGYLEHTAFQFTGIIILVFSIVFVRISQNQLKKSWRIGVDRAEKNELITHGIYRKSRNPIALGMLLTLLGFFLVIPNVFTFAILCVSLVIANIRIKIEEEYLSQVHGTDYLEYTKRTRKWI